MKKRQRKKSRKLFSSHRSTPSGVIVPAGRRADKLGYGGIPVPSDESIHEAFQWVQEHQQ